MQITFFVELEFWVKSLETKHYKDHVGRKRIENRMGTILWSLKTYEYIGSKTKSYQIQKRFFLPFIFLGYQVVPSSHVLSDLSNATPSLCLQGFL